MLNDLVYYALNKVRRNSKADSNRACCATSCRSCCNRRVNTNHFPRSVESWAARITWINCCINLYSICNDFRTTLIVHNRNWSIKRRNNACCSSIVVSKRISDCHYWLANCERVRIRKINWLYAARQTVYFKHSQICCFICSNKLSLVNLTVRKRYLKLLHASNNVVVCNNVTLLVDYCARAFAHVFAVARLNRHNAARNVFSNRAPIGRLTAFYYGCSF